MPVKKKIDIGKYRIESIDESNSTETSGKYDLEHQNQEGLTKKIKFVTSAPFPTRGILIPTFYKSLDKKL